MQAYESKFICDELKKKNLVEFIGREAGVSFTKIGNAWRCLCPMPFHKDSKPSFFVYCGDDINTGSWSFHCFGCQSNGSIIDFCMMFKGMDKVADAIDYLMKSFGIESNYDLVVQAVQDIGISVNKKKKTDSEHYLASCMCRRLVRAHSDSDKIKNWVNKAYMSMNSMLRDDDYKNIEVIADKASRLFQNPDMVDSEVFSV
jgi:hypothetical protein